MMFGRSGYSRAISADIGEIERRLRALERNLERFGGRTSARAAQTADRVGETVATALTSMAERFRNHAGSMSNEAARCGGEGAKHGTDPLPPLPSEVERHPLVTLAVAVGGGVLVGLASSRR